jgi:hypothetical protein
MREGCEVPGRGGQDGACEDEAVGWDDVGGEDGGQGEVDAGGVEEVSDGREGGGAGCVLVGSSAAHGLGAPGDVGGLSEVGLVGGWEDDPVEEELPAWVVGVGEEGVGRVGQDARGEVWGVGRGARADGADEGRAAGVELDGEGPSDGAGGGLEELGVGRADDLYGLPVEGHHGSGGVDEGGEIEAVRRCGVEEDLALGGLSSGGGAVAGARECGPVGERDACVGVQVGGVESGGAAGDDGGVAHWEGVLEEAVGELIVCESGVVGGGAEVELGSGDVEDGLEEGRVCQDFGVVGVEDVGAEIGAGGVGDGYHAVLPVHGGVEELFVLDVAEDGVVHVVELPLVVVGEGVLLDGEGQPSGIDLEDVRDLDETVDI